jgi:hypothetical protein
MKNITITIDDETHRQARIRAAELGTSVSALVKDYLGSLTTGESVSQGVREMTMPFKPAPAGIATPPLKGPEGQPYFVNGQWVWTKDGKPRKPGGLKGKLWMADDFDEWPADILASFDAWPYDDPDYDPLPFDDAQLPSK